MPYTPTFDGIAPSRNVIPVEASRIDLEKQRLELERERLAIREEGLRERERIIQVDIWHSIGQVYD